MQSKIIISKCDHARLRGLLSSPRMRPALEREDLLGLFDELDRAMIVEAEQLPADVVALGSTVLVRDLGSHEEVQYTLVLPHEANVSRGRISVLAPLGTALLGSRVGEEIEWHMPGGLRRLHISAVEHSKRNDDDPDASAPKRRAA